MKNEKRKQSFPLDITEDIQRREMNEGLRDYENLSEKEKKYIVRIYPFTPNADIAKKFGIKPGVLNDVKYWAKENNLEMKKSETFARTVVPVHQGGKLSKKTKEGLTPGGMLSNYLDTVSEEERRQIINMFEEGIEPIPLLEQVIAIQSHRAIRGSTLERNSDITLHKTVNDAFDGLHSMIKTLHEMNEGQRITHDIGDSFMQLVLQSNARREEYGREED
jgi:hypothetical protein